MWATWWSRKRSVGSYGAEPVGIRLLGLELHMELVELYPLPPTGFLDIIHKASIATIDGNAGESQKRPKVLSGHKVAIYVLPALDPCRYIGNFVLRVEGV